MAQLIHMLSFFCSLFWQCKFVQVEKGMLLYNITRSCTVEITIQWQSCLMTLLSTVFMWKKGYIFRTQTFIGKYDHLLVLWNWKTRIWSGIIAVCSVHVILVLFFFWRVYFCCCGALLVECCAVCYSTHICMYAVADLSSFLLLFSCMALFLCDEEVKEGACLVQSQKYIKLQKELFSFQNSMCHLLIWIRVYAFYITCLFCCSCFIFRDYIIPQFCRFQDHIIFHDVECCRQPHAFIYQAVTEWGALWGWLGIKCATFWRHWGVSFVFHWALNVKNQ